MKKLLFFVLLAMIACSTIPEEDVVLEGIDWKAAWEKVKKVFNDAITWLKDNDLYEPLINLIKTKGKEKALNWCKGERKIPENVCTSIVNWVIDHIH